MRQKVTSLGDRQIVSIHGPGDVLNFQNAFLEFPDYDIRAVGACEVSFVEAVTIKELASERPAVARSLLIGAFIEASTAREWMLNMGQRTARTRIAHFLCEYLERVSLHRYRAGNKYELWLTQNQIGDATGMTAVHVNRMLKGLHADNLIIQTGRLISVPNMDALKEAGQYNSRYLHLPQTV